MLKWIEGRRNCSQFVFRINEYLNLFSFCSIREDMFCLFLWLEWILRNVMSHVTIVHWIVWCLHKSALFCTQFKAILYQQWTNYFSLFLQHKTSTKIIRNPWSMVPGILLKIGGLKKEHPYSFNYKRFNN